MTYQDRRRIEIEYERSCIGLRRTVVLMVLALAAALLVELAVAQPVAAVTIGSSELAP